MRRLLPALTLVVAATMAFANDATEEPDGGAVVTAI